MILVWLIVILLGAGALAWLAGRFGAEWPRWISLVAAGFDLALVLDFWARHRAEVEIIPQGRWLAEFNRAWVPQYGIHFHLAMDGLSLLMVALTLFIGMMAVLCSWKEIQKGVGFYHFNLMWILAGILGVFLAVDLFLFYFAWELMLVPMYFLIAIWGHEHRVYAAIKFFIFTQLSGLLMLLAILGLYFVHHHATGVYTFEYSDLLGTPMSPRTAMLLMLGFFVAFAVKLPMFPFHPWLPDAHTEAPTAGSLILAALLLKTGAYGMIRFVVPLFPGAARAFAPIAMTLGVVGILYGAVLAYGQTDFKRMVAYTSVSHLGFVLLGIFAWNTLALQGAVVGMIAHALSTGALFMLVGQLYERTRTRDLNQLGGLWATAPVLSGVGMFFMLGSVGLPGLGDFVGEFLVLLGTYRAHVLLTALATVGVLASTFYGVQMVQRAFHGPNVHHWKIADLHGRELLIMGPMMILLLGLGLYPLPVLKTFSPAWKSLERSTRSVVSEARR